MNNANAALTDAYPMFDRAVPPNGYCWWYFDAVSDDQQHMMTVIAFVGSVFSPYYKSARRRNKGDPLNHCSINVVLYGRDKNHWCMTERYQSNIQRDAGRFVIGPSSLTFSPNGPNNGVLTIEVNEKTAPLPSSVKGQIEIDVELQVKKPFTLDGQSIHYWWPVAPNSRIRVDLDAPDLSWQGNAYVDMNWGSSPIENDIDYWCWSRFRSSAGTTIFYDVYNQGTHLNALSAGNSIAKPDTSHSILITENGQVETVTPPQLHELKKTRWWKMARHARGAATTPDILKTLEDTPFYSRSAIRSEVPGQGQGQGQATTGIHESVSLTRFKQPVVQAMLRCRMPRWSGAAAL